MSTATDLQLGDPTAAPREGRHMKWIRRILVHGCILIGVVLSIFPFYWLVVMSTNTTGAIFSYPPSFSFGGHFTENVRNLLNTVDLFSAMLNTLIVAGSLSFLVMFFCSLAAFTFAKYDFPGKTVLFASLLVTFLLPASLSLVPSFVLMSTLGWVGRLEALIIPGAASAFGIFLLRQFAQNSIPNELIESARIDGAGFFRIYLYIAVPMLRAGLAFLGIFTFISAWNDYVWPLIILINPERQTLQPALQELNSIYGTDYGMVMAGALISVLPLIGVFIIGQRHFIANIAAGALKG